MNIWIGLAHVQPRSGNELLEGAKGAFVPVVGMAKTIPEFSDLLINMLESYSFDVLEIEDIELFEERLKSFDVDSELRELVSSLSETHPVALSAFDAYLE